MPIAGANVQISTGGTVWCNVTADANGAYTCPARTIGGGDYSFVATVQGAWGETTRSYTINASSLPAMGASGSVTANLYGDPTTLRLTGTLVNPDDQPLAGASVTATGDIVGSTTTNSAGVYDVYILTNTTGNHNFTLTVTVGSFSVQREIQLTLIAGELRTHREDIEFTQRAFTMNGYVVNAFIPGMTLAGATVVLSSTELGEWCNTTSTSTGSYQCPTINLQQAYRSDTPFRFTATIDSIWGKLVQSYTIPVQDLPAVGTSATLTRNLAVAPTTLRVTGVVRGGSGIPLGNASVQVYGAALSTPASTTATSDGRYTVDIVIKPNITSGTLSFAVNGNNATETLLLTGLQTTLLNERSKDLWTLGRTIATLAGTGANGFTGDGGSAQAAQLSEPFDVTRGPNGSLYVIANDRIRQIASDGVITTLTTDMVIASPRGIAVGPDGSLYVGQYSSNGRVYKVHPTSGATSIVASNLNLPTRLAVDPIARVLYVSEIDGKKIRRYDLDTQQGSIFVDFPSSRITDLNVGPDGSVYFIAMDNRTVRRVPRDWNGTGTPEIVAGQAGQMCTSSAVPSCGDGGPATSATLVFWEYSGIAIGADGSLYIATSAQRPNNVGHRIRWVDAATGIIHTIAGTGVGGYRGEDVPATTAQINRPSAMELLDGDILIFADTDNHRVRWLGRQNLELQGMVQDHRGVPLAGAVVTARSSLFVGNATTVTAADGVYSLFPRLTAMSGTLTLEAQYARLRSPQTTLSITLQTGDLVRRTLPISITERYIRIYGTIRNTLTTEPVRGIPTTVTIQHAGQPLCITQTTRDGTYSCTTNTTQLDAFDVTVQASGAWQSPATPVTVPAGSAAQITSVQFDPALTPTTLRLSGTITRAGTPVAAARVELDLPNGHRVLTYTNAAGVYQLELALPPAVNTTRLHYHISDGNLAPDFSHYLSESLSIATPATVISRTRSLDLAAPDAVVRGSVARTVAGSGFSGFSGDGGAARAANLNGPQGLAVAADGTLYIADTANHRIRRVTPDGMITTVAGGGSALDGDSTRAATSVRLVLPASVLLAPDGSLYVADTGNHRIRRIAPDGTLSTLAGSGSTSIGGYSGDGGSADMARLNSPNALALHPDGSLYVADTGNQRIRRIAPDGTISTVAGNGSAGATGDGGPATSARLNGPQGLALALDGTLYIADTNNHRIRVVSPDGIIRTLAGNGSAGSIGDGGLARDAQFNAPTRLVLDQGGTLYIADTNNHRIRMITPDGIIRTRAGSTNGFSGDGTLASTARFYSPVALALAQDGTLYIADRFNHRIRTLGRASLEIIGTVQDQLGGPVANAPVNASGTLLQTTLSSSSDGVGAYRFFPEQPYPDGTLMLEATLTTSAGSLTASQNITASLAPDLYTQLRIPLTFTERYVHVAGTIFNGTTDTVLRDIASTIQIAADGQPLCSTLARTDGTYACTFRTTRSAAFTTDISATGDWGSVSTTASVPAGSAPIVVSVIADITAYPTIIRLSGQLTDAGSPVAHARIAVENHLDVATPQARTHTDSNGAYQLDIPLNAGVTSTDLYFLIEQRLRAGTTIGTTSTVNSLQVSQLNVVQRDLELSDPGYTSAPLVATTRAGTGIAGYSGDSGAAETARLNNPKSVAVAPDGSLYIADTDNYRIRKVAPDGNITTVAGNGTYGFNGDGMQATSSSLRSPASIAIGLMVVCTLRILTITASAKSLPMGLSPPLLAMAWLASWGMAAVQQVHV